MRTARPGRTAEILATAVLTAVLAGDAVRYLVGWGGYVAVVGVLLALVVVRLAGDRGLRTPRGWVPLSVAAYLGVAALSLLWSAYPGATLLGLGATLATTAGAVWLGLGLDLVALTGALARALRIILASSLVFEAFVAIVVRRPVLPFWTDYGTADVPDAFYWSRALFPLGPIQGVVGNRNILAMLALVALVVFAARMTDRLTSRTAGWAWIGVAVLTLALTRSGTVALVAVVVLVAWALAAWARRREGRGRARVYATAVGALAAAAVALAVGWSALLAVFGKSPDVTGRLDIWESVTALAAERPLLGWGWVSYWVPWVEPFDGLAVRNGVEYLQAHNAWLDVWLQLGVVGVVLLAAVVLSTTARTWFLAVDAPVDLRGAARPRTAVSLVPFLLVIALVAQSAAESRILIEWGWTLVVAFAVLTRRRRRQPGGYGATAVAAEAATARSGSR